MVYQPVGEREKAERTGRGMMEEEEESFEL